MRKIQHWIRSAVISSGIFLANNGEAAVVHYPVNAPHNLKVHYAIDADQVLAGRPFHSHVEGKVNAAITVNSTLENQGTIPEEVQVTLQGWNGCIRVNEEKTCFSSDIPNTSGKFAIASIHDRAANAVMEQPLHFSLQFKEDGELIVSEAVELEDLKKQYPVLNNLLPNSFFTSMFQQMFAVVGKDVEVGSQFKKSLMVNEKFHIPVTYEMQEGEGDRVESRFIGKAKKDDLLPGCDTLGGSYQGIGQWETHDGLNLHLVVDLQIRDQKDTSQNAASPVVLSHWTIDAME